MNDPSDLIVPLHSRRRQRAALVQKLQHVAVAVALLSQGIATLGRSAEPLELGLGVIEVVTSLLLIGAMLRAVRGLRAHGPKAHGHAHGVDWVDIFVAGVLAAEAFERWHTSHHVPRPTILLALVTLTIGLFHGRIAAFGSRKRALRVTSQGVSISRRPFGRLTWEWAALRDITITPSEAIIYAHDGSSRRIDLRDSENAPDVVAALEEARERLGAAAARANPESGGEEVPAAVVAIAAQLTTPSLVPTPRIERTHGLPDPE